MHQDQPIIPELFKGIALFTPGGDLIYCIDPSKHSRWHLNLCVALQEVLGLPEPPHFLVPCYTATIDKWLNPETQEVTIAAEAYPPVLQHQILLNAVFGTGDLVWQPMSAPDELCNSMVIATYYHQFPQLWENHELVMHYQRKSLEPKPKFQWRPSVARTSVTPPEPQGYVLRLYISGHSAATEHILHTLHQLLEKSLGHPYTLRVIDVLKHPEQAEADQIAATPTLIKVWPQPARKIVGELSDLEHILQLLGTFELDYS